MTLSLVSLLLHEEDVPASARAALRAALVSSDGAHAHLAAAANALYREANLDCEDARELVGLSSDGDQFSCFPHMRGV